MPCRCDPTRGQSCPVCSGDSPAVEAAEYRRDWGDDPEHDLQRAERAYESYLFGDAA